MPLQVPQLDDRSFEQLFAEAKARIPVHTPEWTNLNDSDPGITLVQLFAFMTDNLLYRSNRIPEANRLAFLKLLNIPLQPAMPARGLVAFRNERGPVQPYPLDAGVELRAGKVPFITRTGVCILPVTAAVFYKRPTPDLDDATRQQYQTVYAPLLDQAGDQLQFYTSTPLDPPQTGKEPPVVDLADGVNGTIDRSLWVALVGPPNVPLDTVRAAIADQTLTLGIYPAPSCQEKVLEPANWTSPQENASGLIFEIAAPDPTIMDTLAPAHYTRLPVEYGEAVLDEAGIVQVTLPSYDALVLWDFDPGEEGSGDYPPLVEDASLAQRIATWIRIRLPEPAANGDAAGGSPALRQSARVSWVGANAARVIQALPVNRERLGIGTGAPDQVFKVANTPVILEAIPDPETGALRDTFRLEIQSTDGTWEAWTRTDDLFAAGPRDKVYAVDPEAGLVSFGSGLRGMRPPLGQAIRVSYEYGGGPAGNVGIGALNKSAALPGGFKVENPVPTWGADAGETAADGERNIPRYLKHRDRLVTASDFRDLTLRTPGVDVGRVEVLPLFNPDLFSPTGPPQTAPGTVTVMVIPRHDARQPEAPVPDRLFLEAVCAWLDPRRLLTTEIFVRGPEYVSIWVTVGITTAPGQVRELVRRNVEAALRVYLSPLVGGPPIPGAPDLDAVCDPTAAPTAPCAPPRGTGWPLGTEVRDRDLEAVATRVIGVRYVDSVRLASLSSDGVTLTDADRIPLAGLQLPRLVAISVREGAAEDPAELLGPRAATPSTTVPVPVLPKQC